MRQQDRRRSRRRQPRRAPDLAGASGGAAATVREAGGGPPLRVLFLCAQRPSGPEYVGRRRNAEHLDPHAVDSFFVWQRHTSATGLDRPARLAGGPGRNLFLDFGRDVTIDPRPPRTTRALMMLARIPGATWRVRRLILAERIDVIYTAQQWLDVLLGRVLARACRIEHVVHLHYPATQLDQLTMRIIRSTPRVLAVSHFARRTAIECGVSPAAVQVVHNSVDLEQYVQPRIEGGVRDGFGWGPECKVILAAGRLDPDKGHLDLLAAFALVAARVPEARLLVCGASTMRDDQLPALQHEARRLGVDDRVVFAGHRRDLQRLYASCDAFCLPSRDEAFGNVYAEALAAGLPVVASRSGGVPEIVVHGVTGLLSAPGDVAALAGDLVRVLSDPVAAARLTVAGRVDVRERFDPAAIAARWTTLLLQPAAYSQMSDPQHRPPPIDPFDPWTPGLPAGA